MEIINCKIRDIKPYDKNAKQHSTEQVKKIADSIREFGFNQPIVVDKDNVIIVGHGRYLAAQRLGLEEVPVLVADISKEKAKAYRLADNKLNESDWDMALVVDELKELSLEMVELTGFDKELILDIKNEEEEHEDKNSAFITKVVCPECGLEFNPKNKNE
jgi:site-specific DNA-methyltransferase (adenine-specific)